MIGCLVVLHGDVRCSFAGGQIWQVMRFLRSRCITRAKKGQLVAALRQRLQAVSPTGQVSSEDEDALQGLEKVREAQNQD